MKVIFVQNIEDKKAGDIKNVADGYARNFLIPKNIAIPATPEEIKNIEKKMKKIKKEEEEKIKKLEVISKKLEKLSLNIYMEAGEKDDEGNRVLFGSVTNMIIREKLEEKGFDIDKKQIEIGETIKHLGNYEIIVKLGHGVNAKVKIEVRDKKEKGE